MLRFLMFRAVQVEMMVVLLAIVSTKSLDKEVTTLDEIMSKFNQLTFENKIIILALIEEILSSY